MVKNFFSSFKNGARYIITYNIMVTYFILYMACFIFLVIKTPCYIIPNVYDFNLNNLPHEKFSNLTSRSVFPYSVQ